MSRRTSIWSPSSLAAALLLLLPACNWLNMNRVNSAQKKPNNAWVFFTVERTKDAPVTGLSAEDFKISEDGHLVSPADSKQLLVDPDSASVTFTMLLLDMSGSAADSGQSDALIDAAESFAERVGKVEKVGVYAFDGEEKIHGVLPFGEAQGPMQGKLDSLRHYKAKDPSTNLHGAVVEGLRELKRSLDREQKPLRFGTLVVFTDGTDRAGRVSADDMRKEMDDEKYKGFEILAVNAGADVENVARDGAEVAGNRGSATGAFEKIAAKIEAHKKRGYLLSYCTPARSGKHEVRIEVHVKNPDASGSLSYDFNADGLGPPPDCDPTTPPSFDQKPAPTAEEKEETPPPPAKGGAKDATKGGHKPVLIGPAGPPDSPAKPPR